MLRLNPFRKNKPSGYALCVGLNSVSPDHYGGWSGELNACEYDAHAMEKLLKKSGFVTRTLLTREATSAAFDECVSALQQVAKSGDTIVVTSSDHGGQLKDYDGNEADGKDETICLFDRQFIDDELNNLWAGFAKGVRILYVADSCHSGTVSRAFGAAALQGSKAVPRDVLERTALENHWLYREVAAAARARSKPIKASLLALGACADNQLALDGMFNGAFTEALLEARRENPKATYGQLRKRCGILLPPTQSPQYTYGGARCPEFESAPAFTI